MVTHTRLSCSEFALNRNSIEHVDPTPGTVAMVVDHDECLVTSRVEIMRSIRAHPAESIALSAMEAENLQVLLGRRHPPRALHVITPARPLQPRPMVRAGEL